MKRLALALCLLIAPLRAAAPAKTLEAAAPKAPVLQGAFEQEKRIKGFKRALKSRGRFTLAQGKGVLWRIERPFVSAVCVDAKGLWQLEQGPQGFARKALHQGDMSLALGLVQKVLGGDRAALRQAFDVTELPSPAKGTWSLELRPRDAGLRQAITSVQVEGAVHVRKVRYQEANGDSTSLSFKDLRESQAVDKVDAGAWGD